MTNRKIIHIDMDAFYASVEQKLNPSLRGKPVIVGGRPEDRGVVATCSYEARRFGIHSAMATSMALRLCPQAILIEPRFNVYESFSRRIHKIFHEYTDLVEPISLDEAYLDVTENKKGIRNPVHIAREIKRKIFLQTGLTASAGVSYNKFLAKVASGYKKPNGLTIVTPAIVAGFLARLPIGSFYGVGKVTEKKMLSLGIKNGADLRKVPLRELIKKFGKSGLWFYQLARGIDETPVEPYHKRLSFGREVTLPEDVVEIETIKKILQKLSEEVSYLLVRNEVKGKTITLKLKYYDFKLITRNRTLNYYVDSQEEIYSAAAGLISKTEAGTKKVRLVGISVSHLNEEELVQPELPFRF